jgi:acetylornithine deacetylase/succinyl-diaminopimelate desuccinylase-like protein
MDIEKNKAFLNEFWDQAIIPALMEYIHIPNKSPHFDPLWEQHGYMEQAVRLIVGWCKKNGPEDLNIQVVTLPGRTPVIFMEIPGEIDDTVLMYGHLDKQPEMSGWDADLHPWKPVLKDDKLYGRGSADDGYAAFASLAAVLALRAQKQPHPRCIILIEACEESGSYDLPFYVEALEKQIGNPSLIICLDSGCHNYEQLWVTTSLRGLVSGTLHIETLTQGIHSGVGSGIVPSCFQILRTLLNRIEDEISGEIILTQLHVDVPEQRNEQIKQTAKILEKEIYKVLPFAGDTLPVSADPYTLLLNQTWKPALSLIGIENVPNVKNAGNVTLPKIAVKFSMRIPPTGDAEKAAQLLKNILEANPPYHANIRFDINDSASGWNAPLESPWLTQAANEASHTYFGPPAAYMGEGGSIPFMGMLGKKFPQAQFLITGVLGPGSNAHGPNEFLHIPTAKKLTGCISHIILATRKNSA